MRYADGFLIPIPTKNVKAYTKMARMGKRLWLKHGALDYQECVVEERKPAFGIPFPRGLRVRSGETVVLAWIVFRSKAHRNAVNAKVMKAMGNTPCGEPPFDCKRLLYGGFSVIAGK
ncbi:MAG: DUF1428 domain-containing protein [Planctomycetota bacterium]